MDGQLKLVLNHKSSNRWRFECSPAETGGTSISFAVIKYGEKYPLDAPVSQVSLDKGLPTYLQYDCALCKNEALSSSPA